MSMSVYIKPKTWKTAQKMLIQEKEINARLEGFLPEDMKPIQDSWKIVKSKNLEDELKCYGYINPSSFVFLGCNQCGDRTIREFKLIKKNALKILKGLGITNVKVERG